MKKASLLLASFAFAFVACNNPEQIQTLRALTIKDSTLAAQAQKKDSTITAYITTLNEIQDNLDSIKVKEKILSSHSAEKKPSIIADIKSLDKLILKNNHKIYLLEKRLRKAGDKNSSLEKMVARLTKELTEKNAEIVALQSKLAQTSDSLRALTRQFNDSIAVMDKQKLEINAMRTEINSVYYAIGTMKELKNKNVIDKKGGVIGLGRTAEMKEDFNKSYFTHADMQNLHAIPLYGKFSELVTHHPKSSYKITGTAKADSLLITDPVAFWSESKYLVIVVK